jgi:hypothetical protein
VLGVVAEGWGGELTMPDVFTVDGLIGIRWREWGGADGPFGSALSGEDPIPGTAGRRQRFERGEMVWAPEQDMLVSAFRLRNGVGLQWSIPRFDHEYFRCNAFFNGQAQGLDQNTTIQPVGPGSDAQLWLRLQGFGDYGFQVASFDGDDHTAQGWTVPVNITLGLVPGLVAPQFPVDPPFVERWHELGASDGPMGQPTSAARQFAVPGSTAWAQDFEHGQIITHFALGPDFMMSAHQVGDILELNWGGFTAAYDKFRVDITRNDVDFQQASVEESGLDWARPGRGSGRFILDFSRLPPSGDATYSFVVNPAFGTVIAPGDPIFPATAPVTIGYVQPPPDAPLDPLPLDGSPGQAFASHHVRAKAIARHFVQTRRMDGPTGIADEDSSIQLIAHLQVLSVDPGFHIPGELPHRVIVNTLLRSSTQGPGAMGTSFDTGIVVGSLSRAGDYDMALKGLMVVLHRYRDLLNDDQINFIVRDLIPARLPGPIDPGFESYQILTETVPETENHLLMMNSSKYLINKVLFERTGDAQYDNTTNGVRDWLLNHMANFARYDFMEFNARPYQRLSLHSILNLHEFGDPELQTAAQIVLDYVMTKFAISSSRARRVPPFRRLKENVNQPDNDGNALIGGNVDQVANLFLTYVGPTALDGKPWPWFLTGWAFNGVIAGPAAYRPPPAAYIAALAAHEPVQHRFYHGTRPAMTASEDIAEGGVELYYNSTSFLLSAGGMFLNSGYGLDDLQGYKQVAIAQSTTLIPVRADATFAELIRFDPYPGDRDADDKPQLQRDAVNTGVHLGFACGANLEVPERWPLTATASWDGPWLLLDLNSESLGPAGNQPDRRLGFYLAIYRTPVADPERLKVNYGTVPSNFGWLYASEATAMSFEMFADRIRSRNTFPAELDWDAKYTFTTPEEPPRAFDFWMRPDQFKYVPRIFNVDGQPVLIDGFTSLPLVDGPYLQASGHEGRLEIRGPGQDPASAPLVLDYRQPLNPIRTDNADSWPQPLIDRARAIMAYSLDLIGKARAPLDPAKPIDPLDYLRSAVDVFRGFNPPATIQAEYLLAYGQAVHVLVAYLLGIDGTDEALKLVREGVQVELSTVAAPGANPVAAVPELTAFAGLLSGLGQTAEGAAAQQALVDMLQRFSPPEAARAEYELAVAEAVQNLIVRLLDDHRPDTVAALAPQAITAYREYAATAGADILRVARDLTDLDKQLDGLGLTTQALDAQQAAVDVLSGFTPAEADRPDDQIAVAEARHNLIVRLLENSRPAEAANLVAQTLTAYRDYVAAPGADLTRVARDLAELAGLLAQAGLTAEAADTQRTLDQINAR